MSHAIDRLLSFMLMQDNFENSWVLNPEEKLPTNSRLILLHCTRKEKERERMVYKPRMKCQSTISELSTMSVILMKVNHLNFLATSKDKDR